MKLRYLKEKQKKVFFFEKKNQKTFARSLPRRCDIEASVAKSAGEKVFCFFFSKKNQKLLLVRSRAGAISRRQLLRAQEKKFFASFFQKRRPFFLY